MTQEELDAQATGATVVDAEKDTWTKLENGEWRYEEPDNVAALPMELSSSNLIHVWGPVQLLEEGE
jgi:hypothetical protein